MADSTVIAFIGVFAASEDGTYVGAAMVTNERGYPSELRVTTTVRPSAVQRALYGESLERYVSAELIVGRLAGELQQRPTVGVVNRLVSLDAVSPFPLGFVGDGESLVLREGSYAFQQLENTLDPAAPVTVVAADNDACVAVSEALGPILRYFDPLGAFERMQTALRVLAESDARYR